MKKIFITLIIAYVVSIIINNILLLNTQDIKQADKYFKQFKINFLKINIIKENKITNTTFIKNEPIRKFKNNIINNVSLISKINILAIIINEKKKQVFFSDGKKEYFLKLNEKYLDYTIYDINKNFIKLIKNNRITIIKFDKNSIDYIPVASTEIVKDIDNKNTSNDFIVDSKLLDKYIKNPRKALREIYVAKKNNQYYVSRLKNNSVFYNFGIRKNDIIISLNEEPVSESLFLNIYKNYNKIDSLNIEIERNGERLEFNYEIER
jgi:type II secretory pathway component PulC